MYIICIIKKNKDIHTVSRVTIDKHLVDSHIGQPKFYFLIDDSI